MLTNFLFHYYQFDFVLYILAAVKVVVKDKHLRK